MWNKNSHRINSLSRKKIDITNKRGCQIPSVKIDKKDFLIFRSVLKAL